MTREEIACLNLLALLKKENATFKELLNTGVFRNPKDLMDGIDILEKGGCIKRIETERTILYVVQENGLRLLKNHPNWKLHFDRNFEERMYAVREGVIVKLCEGRKDPSMSSSP